MSERAAEGGASWILGDQRADRRLDLLELVPELAEGVPLEPVGGEGSFRLRAFAERQGLLDELLALGEPARRQRQHRAPSVYLPELSGLSELVGNACECVETGLQFADLSDHYLPDEPVQVPV